MIIFILFLMIFAIIVWQRPILAIWLFLAVLPSYLLRFTLLGVPLTVLEGMIFILFARLVIDWRRGKEKIKFDSRLIVALAALVGASIVAVAVSPDTRAALGIFKAYIVEPILFFAVAKSYLEKKDIPSVVTALSVGALGVALYGLGQRFFGIPIVAPWQSELRITSVFEYPNAVGLYLAPLIPLFVWQLLARLDDSSKFTFKKKIAIAYWVLIILSSLAAIYFAKTWGAMVALAAVGIFVGCWFKRTRRATIAVVLSFIIALGVASVSRHQIIQKITFQSWSGIVRLKMYQETWMMLKNSPIFGAGLAGYQQGILPYHTNSWMEIFLYPHDLFLTIWSELGLLGLAAAGLTLAWFIKQLLARRDNFTWALGATMSVIIIHGLVDVPYFKNDLAVMFWLFMALVSISNRRSDSV